MITKLTTACFAVLAAQSAIAASEPSDLLRFTNGDQLHGTYQGIKDGNLLIWQREDVSSPVDFKVDQLRHVVLRGGRPSKAVNGIANVALVNGDRIPGTIVAMDDKTLTLETAFAGVLHFPRNQVEMFAPNPLGGKLNYHGPFVEDEWKMAHAAFPDGFPAVNEKAARDSTKPDEPGRWEFSGSAWYWKNKGSGTAIIRENAMPDRSILRFDLAWKNRLSVAIGFNSDLAKPAKQNDEEKEIVRRPIGFVPGDSSILPKIFGNSYVLQMFSMQMILYRTSIADDGTPSIERVQINGSGPRLSETGKATVEIRSNRLTGVISLFMNGDFVAQWNESIGGAYDSSKFAGKGNSFGFVVQAEDSPVKISDVMVGEWNGMPDSARSMETEDQDIVLLTNGTDRFSGKVDSFHDGKIQLSGKYGQFQFDLGDVAEIRFARKTLAAGSEPPAESISVQLSPIGRISGRPIAGNGSSIKIAHPVCGEIEVNMAPAVMLDLHKSNNFIDDWNAEF